MVHVLEFAPIITIIHLINQNNKGKWDFTGWFLGITWVPYKQAGAQLAWLGSASTDLRITYVAPGQAWKLIQVSDKLISCDVQIAGWR